MADDAILSPATNASGEKGGKNEDIYQKNAELEHILLRPHSFIGSVEAVTEQQWVFEDGKMVQRQVTYVPGLYKIFDEILVNACDHKQRDGSMDSIKIDIDQENNTVSIWNNGEGIPVVQHQKEKMYVPTMVFGHLRTSSNFNDQERKVTGVRIGCGAKLCNVFSVKFTAETASRKYKRAFKQTWENNMSKAHQPEIKDFTGDDYTRVTFTPDLAKFKMETLDNDIVAIFGRRAYDIAATSGCQVILNGKRLTVKNCKDEFYKKRRDLMLGQLGAEAAKLSNQARFILEICEGKLVIENKKKTVVIEDLRKAKYDPDPIQKWKDEQSKMLQVDEDDDDSEMEKDVDDGDKKNPYNYLLGMPVRSLSMEYKEQLLKERDEKIHELNLLKKKTPEDLYMDDLASFLTELDLKEKQEREDESSGDAKKKGVKAPLRNRMVQLEVRPSPNGD